MSRYFSQERCLQEVKAYIERAETHMENDGYYEAQFDGFEELQDDLFNLETIDLVRCAECRKVREDGGHANCNGYLYCRKWKTLVDEDDYCSWGEREDE